MTTTQQSSNHPKWEAFQRNFKQSNYITDFWNWFMTLMSKAAEMVLFGTVLYSGYQLLPGVPHVPPAIDAAVFVIQQGALDIGGMGLLKLARRAGLPKESFPVRLGVALVVLMILNVALASIKHTLPMIPDGVYVGIETVLLIARAVVAVLFGHAIHALREEYSDSPITVKEAAELQEHLEGLSGELARVQQDFHRQLATELAQMRASFHQQLSSELATLQERFQPYQDGLARLPVMQAQLLRLESSTIQQVGERPALRALPAAVPQQSKHMTNRKRNMQDVHEIASQAIPAAKKFDARTFVFACLQENPALKLAEIEQLALAQHQELSQATASRYRKQFFAKHESSALQAESQDESSAPQALPIEEQRVVGE